MKSKFTIIVLLILSIQVSAQKINFDDYFIHKTLRFDYIHAGNSEGESIYASQLKEEPYWGGSQTNLIDKNNYGEYRLMV